MSDKYVDRREILRNDLKGFKDGFKDFGKFYMDGYRSGASSFINLLASGFAIAGYAMLNESGAHSNFPYLIAGFFGSMTAPWISAGVLKIKEHYKL